MGQTLHGRVRFGDFELDPRAGELHSGVESVVLQEQQLKVLLMLIEREGEIATREEIKKKLWPNDTVVEFDQGINNTIKNLRRLLGDTADHPKYIETIARRGYRLLVPVEWVSEADSSSEEFSAAAENGLSDSDTATIAKTTLKVGRLTGKVVSHYRVLEVIGGGGMGLVYRAEDLKLGRAVALKFLPEEVGDDPRARERFQREAKAVSALDHPNICPVYEFDEYEGCPFIVMQLLQGKSLRDHIAEGSYRLSRPEGLEIAIQIASGLEAAHEKGIIHRDIKPANIFITEKNVAKILDFGVAKMVQVETVESHSTNRRLSGAPEHLHSANTGPNGAPEDKKGRGFSRAVAAPLQEVGGNQFQPELIPAPSLNKAANGTAEAVPLQNSEVNGAPEGAPLRIQRETTLTQTGMKLGTAGYMSPEQVRGEPLDARTDIFSFGLVVYEMATGERAFTGETEAILHDAIEHREPKPVRGLEPQISPKLESAITRCLEKERDQRYQTTADLRAGLIEAHPASAAPELQPPRPQLDGQRRKRWFAAACIALLLVVSVAGILYRRARTTPKLTDKDTIILADFENKTSDPIFDGTFKPALKIAFEQTPYLNPLAGEKVMQVLKMMGRPADERLTPAVAREVCLRTNSTAYIAGSISDAGNQYDLELSATNCKNGHTLAVASAKAERGNQVVAKLGEATYTLRTNLGEPRSSLQRFNKPLAQAMTASLEALQAFARANANQVTPEYVLEAKRATELDTEFADAYLGLGITYYNLWQFDLIEENLRKAYLLRDRRLSGHRRIAAEGLYYQRVTGESSKVISTAEGAIQEFPRWSMPHNFLASRLNLLGEYERAVVALKDGIRLEPAAPFYINLAFSYMALERLQDAKVVLDQAKERNKGNWVFHAQRYRLAFLLHDQAGMNEELRAATSNLQVLDLLLKEESDTEAYHGRMQRGNRLLTQAEGAAMTAGAPGRASVWKAIGALRSARVGENARARDLAQQSLLSNSSSETKRIAAMAFAEAGETVRAMEIAEQLNQQYPGHTLLQGCDLPAIRAEIYLQQGNPSLAMKTLDEAVPHEFPRTCESGVGNIQGLGWGYIRGQAYLKAGRAKEAASEFERTLQRPGYAAAAGNLLTMALAHLQLARAQVMMGDQESARNSYQDFLTLWKDADPDIPIYRQAKAEYAKLNGGKSPSGARR
jgi:serine/threonine protein kinase/tetratricopeptide (TPR) repeat protein